tara:strand:- start:204 stop:623 length:420 start_codon:yes stop_codon:yes gene_type:complete
MSGTIQSTDYNQQITMENEAEEEEEYYEDELPILPTVLENIIIDYVYQLYHVEDFQGCINRINDIYYVYYEEDGFQLSRRGIATGSFYRTESVEYYQINNENSLYFDHYYEFRCDTTIRLSRIQYGNDFRVEDLGTSYD